MHFDCELSTNQIMLKLSSKAYNSQQLLSQSISTFFHILFFFFRNIDIKLECCPANSDCLRRFDMGFYLLPYTRRIVLSIVIQVQLKCHIVFVNSSM
jgi:hypothetical protein